MKISREGKVALVLTFIAIAIIFVGMIGLETYFMSALGYTRTEKDIRSTEVVYRYINKDPALADTDFVEVHKLQDIAVSDLEEKDGKMFRHTIGLGITEISWVNERDVDTPTPMTDAAWSYLWVKMVPAGFLILFVILVAIADVNFFVLYLYKQNNPSNDARIKESFKNSLFISYIVFVVFSITLNAGFLIEHGILALMKKIAVYSLRYKFILCVSFGAMLADIAYISWCWIQYKKDNHKAILKAEYPYNIFTFSSCFILYAGGAILPDYNNDLIWMLITLSMIARLIITICNHKIRTEKEVLIPVEKIKAQELAEKIKF